jgi:division protein CdvB (Snf7/Vps24/ESCRT-III family)
MRHKIVVVDFKAVGKNAAQIKAESFIKLGNVITEIDNVRMRLQSLGEIREMKADPSLVAGYETNETNYISQAERFP